MFSAQNFLYKLPFLIRTLLIYFTGDSVLNVCITLFTFVCVAKMEKETLMKTVNKWKSEKYFRCFTVLSRKEFFNGMCTCFQHKKTKILLSHLHSFLLHPRLEQTLPISSRSNTSLRLKLKIRMAVNFPLTCLDLPIDYFKSFPWYQSGYISGCSYLEHRSFLFFDRLFTKGRISWKIKVFFKLHFEQQSRFWWILLIRLKRKTYLRKNALAAPSES